MFKKCEILTKLDLSKWEVSNVTNMNGMFFECKKLESIGNISTWNISNVTDMKYMFKNCEKAVIDCSQWKVNNEDMIFDFNFGSPGVIIPTVVSY